MFSTPTQVRTYQMSLGYESEVASRVSHRFIQEPLVFWVTNQPQRWITSFARAGFEFGQSQWHWDVVCLCVPARLTERPLQGSGRV
jgi:hypothetical protein